jgi:hypothetical protein
MMNERIHRVLDGELPLEALSQQERLELLRYGISIGAIADIRQPPAPPDLSPAVMGRLADLETVPATHDASAALATHGAPSGNRSAERPGRSLHRLGAWLWQPRAVTVRLRPALAAAALAGLAGLAALGVVRSAAPAGPPGADVPRVFVQFRLDHALAERVALAGDFTGWRPVYELHQTEQGVWSVTVPLEPGVHDYAFVVDGDLWLPDPLAATVEDGFGGTNSRVSVLVPETGRSS